MNKIITIGSILLTFAVSMPALSSSGLMTYANPSSIKKMQAKMKSPAFKEGGREAFKNITKHYENEEKNRKLISPLENWAIQDIKPLTTDLLVKIGNDYEFAGTKIRATSRYFNNRIKTSIDSARDFCDGKRQSVLWQDSLAEIYVPRREHETISITLPKGFDPAKMETVSDQILQLKRLQDLEDKINGKDSKEYLEASKKIDFNDIDNSLKALWDSRIKAFGDSVGQNNNDCLKAFRYAIVFDDTQKLKNLLKNNKETIKLSVHHYPEYLSSLYRDWVVQAVRNKSTETLEFLIREDPFNCKTNYISSGLYTTGVFIDDIDSILRSCYRCYRSKEQREAFTDLCRKHGFKSRLDLMLLDLESMGSMPEVRSDRTKNQDCTLF